MAHIKKIQGTIFTYSNKLYNVTQTDNSVAINVSI